MEVKKVKAAVLRCCCSHWGWAVNTVFQGFVNILFVLQEFVNVPAALHLQSTFILLNFVIVDSVAKFMYITCIHYC